MDNMKHISVLLAESIELLNIKSDGIYVDCTLGGGGHSSEILKRIPEGHLYAFDQDEYAISRAAKRLSEIGSNFTIIQKNFKHIKDELLALGIQKVDGILYDIGVSSFQLDDGERGFSYHQDAELDMRMNQDASFSAKDVINGYSKSELIRVFKEYGEITYAARLADHVIESRPINRTLELVEVIQEAAPGAVRRKGHPAKQVFQAIRIEVNGELDVLRDSLLDALTMLESHGRVVVITFHSLEDRLVKKLFKKAVTVDVPKGLPIREEDIPREFVLVNKKVILPTEDEVEENIRSHSAKLRGIEKL